MYGKNFKFFNLMAIAGLEQLVCEFRFFCWNTSASPVSESPQDHLPEHSLRAPEVKGHHAVTLDRSAVCAEANFNALCCILPHSRLTLFEVNVVGCHICTSPKHSLHILHVCMGDKCCRMPAVAPWLPAWFLGLSPLIHARVCVRYSMFRSCAPVLL